EVRTGGVTGHPDLADLVTGVHGLADRYGELRHVVVPGDGAVLVPDLDLAAVGAGPVGEDHDTLHHGPDPGALRGGEVEAGVVVGPAAAALTEGRGDVVAGHHDLAA